MTDRSDKTHSPGDNELANLYRHQEEFEAELAAILKRELEVINILREIDESIKKACGDSGAKI